MEGIIEFFKACANYFMDMGEIGLFILSVIESSIFPIPPDVILIPMCVANPQNALMLAAITTVGSVIGAAIGYLIGKFGGRPVLDFLFKNKKNTILEVEKLYNKYGVWAVGGAAFTPIPYKVFTIASGVFNMKFIPFILISILGRGLRFFFEGFLLMLFGEKIKSNLELIMIIFAILVVAFYVVIAKWKDIKKLFIKQKQN